jgi:hypothetical protein
LENEHKAGLLTIPQDRIGHLAGAEMLAELPEVPNVPPPGNLPMPYWVCDLCSGAGAISGQIQVNSETGRGICRLRIRNLKLARRFFENVGGKSTPDYARFSEFLDRIEDDRWATMPSVVRHRLEQWFRPRQGERFLGYVPDRARRRSEDGMSGLVISDQRLVYHRPPLHYDVPLGTDLALKVHLRNGREVVEIEAPQLKQRSITLDRGGLMTFRRSLSEGGFNAKWH